VPVHHGRSLTTRGVRTVALLSGEPAGTLAPRVAGLVEFQASLRWRAPEDVPRRAALVVAPGPARLSLSESGDAATRCLSGEVFALTRKELGAGLEAVLRALTTFAALTEAALEVNAVVNVPPRVASPRALEGFARELWEAGFPVRFAPSWTPAPAADVYLGVGGDEELDEFVRSQARWGRI
jgi:hypothetical protein